MYLTQGLMTFPLGNDILFYELIRASKGFDGVFEAGEASRCNTLIAQLKLNANDNLAFAA